MNQYQLPEGWRWAKLGDVCTKAEKRDPRNYPDVPFKYVDISGLDNRQKIIVEARSILGKDAPSRARQAVRTNDVIVATTRPNLNAVALISRDLNNEICSTGFSILRPSELVFPMYVFFFVQTQHFVDAITGQVRGMLYPAVTDKQVREVRIPLPPLPEQRRIAAKIRKLMQDVDHARGACEKQLEAAKALPAAYLSSIFESEEAKTWELKRLGDVCTINPSRPRNFIRSPYALTTFIPMAAVDEGTSSAIKPEVVPYSRVSKGYTYFEENDVLFAKITPCMQNGKHMIARSLVDGIGFGTTEFHVLRPGKDILPEWVWYFIRRECFLQEATTYFTGVVGQQRVPENFLANHNIPCPSLSVQKHLVAKLKEKDEKSNSISIAAKRQLDNINVIPETILNRAFKGEL